MKRHTQRTAFTLIELLTVMAIITILIGILTPALSGARDKARTTAVRAQINAMDVGLESFKGDEGDYVPSNAVLFAKDLTDPVPEMQDWEVGDGTDEAQRLQGAHLLVDAMVGRDFLGFDPKPSDTNGYDRWLDTNDRRAPYIPTDGVDITSDNDPPEDGFGVNTDAWAQPTIDNRICPVFRDKFGWPLLYYRADRKATQNTPMLQDVGESYVGTGVFDGRDNYVFTQPVGPPSHRIDDAHEGLDRGIANYGPSLQDNNEFAEYIRSFRATTYDITVTTDIVMPRPVRQQRSIIISLGKDGIAGTLDDVANFSVLSEER